MCIPYLSSIICFFISHSVTAEIVNEDVKIFFNIFYHVDILDNTEIPNEILYCYKEKFLSENKLKFN